MKNKAKGFFAILLLSGFSCQYKARDAQASLTEIPAEAKEVSEKPEPKSSDQLQGWIYYNSLLNKMSLRDLKIESEQLRKNLDAAESWEDELRLSLVQTAQLLNSRSFQKAAEIFEPLHDNALYSPELRLWLKQYQGQLHMSAQLEKELNEEKKARGELEAKLKALSNIELEMSQREKNDSVR